jgi:autoinducer 2-degrading protein
MALLMQSRNSLEREPRCREFDVSHDPVDPGSFFLYEVYDDQAAFKAHCETQHFADFSILVEPWTESKKVLMYELISDAGTA